MNADCFECGRPAHMKHHVVPRVLGGTRTIPLCEVCHGKAEGLGEEHFRRHRAKIRAGIQKARTLGIRLGRPKVYDTVDLSTLPHLTVREAAKQLGMSKSTLQRRRRAHAQLTGQEWKRE